MKVLRRRWGAWSAVLTLAALGAACSDDEETPVVAPESPPGAVRSIQVTTSGDTALITWSSAAGVTSYRVELSGGGNLTKTATGLSATFTSADGLKDATSYVATIVGIGPGGETPGAYTSFKTNFFVWDEYFATALHNTGRGMERYYEAATGGFEKQTGIPYADLNCKTCHLPNFTGGCTSCHGVDNPGLGATVDASLTGKCGTCHSRQKTEANLYSDVHRAAGMGCMDCHTLGDVHGDGTTYLSMNEEGAIDPKCEDCHKQVENHLFHSSHADDMECAVCHTQSVISCYNCHFETEVYGKKKIHSGAMRDWNFLVNRNGKVALANFQSVKWADQTMVGFGPYYAHTISRNAVKGCSDCHNAAVVSQWYRDGVIDVVTWDAAQGKLVNRKGFIPVPPDFDKGGLRFDFVDLDQVGGSVWSFMESGADRMQILYASPLTEEQMSKLR